MACSSMRPTHARTCILSCAWHVHGTCQAASLGELVEETRRESAELFGESADNITAIVVSFDKIEPAE